MKMNLRCEIELQMSTILEFRYYGCHSMSIKFKYRYIETTKVFKINEIIADIKAIS